MIHSNPCFTQDDSDANLLTVTTFALSIRFCLTDFPTSKPFDPLVVRCHLLSELGATDQSGTRFLVGPLMSDLRNRVIRE